MDKWKLIELCVSGRSSRFFLSLLSFVAQLKNEKFSHASITIFCLASGHIVPIKSQLVMKVYNYFSLCFYKNVI